MRIKIKKNLQIFEKQKNITFDLKNYRQENNKNIYEYKIFVPLLLKHISKVNYIKILASNESLSTIKTTPRIGISLNEKSYKNNNDLITRKTNNTVYKLIEDSKNIQAIRKKTLTLKKFSIDYNLLETSIKDKIIFYPIDVEIVDDNLKKIGYNKETLNLIFLAYDKKNIMFDSSNYTLNHNNIAKTFKNYNIYKQISIKNSNRSFLINNNNVLDNNSQVNIEFLARKDEEINHIIATSNSIKINKKNIINLNKDILNIQHDFDIRPIVKIDGKKIQNIKNEYKIKKPINVKSQSKSNDIECFGYVSQGKQINLIFANINPDISFVELFKRKRYKHNKFEPFKSLGYFSLNSDNIKSFKDFSYTDHDVKNMYTYDYYIRVFDRKKQFENYDNKIVSVFFIKPKQIVSIVNKSKSNNKIDLELKFKSTNLEKIFQKLGRNDYELYKEDLKKTKSITGNIVSLLVEIYDTATGKTRHVGDYNFKNDNNLSIDLNDSLKNSQIVYCTPSITGLNQFLSNELEKKNNLKSIERKTNQDIFSELVESTKKIENKNLSFVGNKYSNDEFVSFNRISHDISNFNEKTGDNIYFSLPQNNNNVFKEATNLNHVITKVKNFKTDSVYTKDDKILIENIYEIDINGIFPSLSDTVQFYLEQSGVKKEISKGHIDVNSGINSYIIDFYSNQKENIVYYDIIDKNKNIILTNRIE